MTTRELTDWITEYLQRTRHVRLRRNNAGRKGRYAYGIAGWPDLVGYDETGRMWAIEIKNRSTRDRQRGAQTLFLEDAAACGCEVAVIGDTDDVMRRWPEGVSG